MARRFKDMQTEEQRYAAQRPSQPAAPARSLRMATHAEWRQMTVNQQAAHLSRLDGREAEAQWWEQREAEDNAPAPKPGIVRRLLGF